MDDEWFWVRLKNGYSLPAVRDGERWSNTDTWQDEPGEVLESEPIPPPSWVAPPSRLWHYVTEKLPEKGDEVLFCARWGPRVFRERGVFWLDEDTPRFESASGPCRPGQEEGEAFAWMPMPEPPPLPKADQ